MLTRKLADEISRQLESDILSYDWLLGITQRLSPNQSSVQRIEILTGALQLLCLERDIRVGQTQLQSGRVHIVHWGASVHETMEMVRKFIADRGEAVTFADGFWIGLPPKQDDQFSRRSEAPEQPPIEARYSRPDWMIEGILPGSMPYTAASHAIFSSIAAGDIGAVRSLLERDPRLVFAR